MEKRIKWGEQGAPSAAVVGQLLRIGKDFKNNAAAMSAVEEAQSKFGRGTLFDETAKLIILVNKAGGKAELAWLCEWFLVLLGGFLIFC